MQETRYVVYDTRDKITCGKSVKTKSIAENNCKKANEIHGTTDRFIVIESY